MTISREERLANVRERNAARRDRRRAEGKCLECEQPSNGKALCAEHRKRHDETQWILRRTPKGRDAERKRNRRKYRKFKRRGLCVSCGKRKTAPTVKCDACSVAHKAWHQIYLDRRDGLRPAKERGDDMPDIPRAVIDPVADFRDGYISIGEAVLAYVAKFNGITTQDVTAAFNADRRERNNISQALRRAVDAGRLRAESAPQEHRLYFPIRTPIRIRSAA